MCVCLCGIIVEKIIMIIIIIFILILGGCVKNDNENSHTETHIY